MIPCFVWPDLSYRNSNYTVYAATFNGILGCLRPARQKVHQVRRLGN